MARAFPKNNAVCCGKFKYHCSRFPLFIGEYVIRFDVGTRTDHHIDHGIAPDSIRAFGAKGIFTKQKKRIDENKYYDK